MTQPSLEAYASLMNFLKRYAENAAKQGRPSLATSLELALRRADYPELKAVPLYTAVEVQGNWRDILCPRRLLESWYTTIHQPRAQPPSSSSKEATDEHEPPSPARKKEEKERLAREKEEFRQQMDKEALENYTISIPGLVDADYTSLEPLPVSKLQKLIGHYRRIEAMNTVLREGSPLLHAFTKAIETGRVKRLLAFDVEAYEHDQRSLLELGVAIYDIPESKEAMLADPPMIKITHYIMEENRRKKNGRFCADNQENFSFGKSHYAPTTRVLALLLEEMRQPHTAIIGHNLPADLKYLVEARSYASSKAEAIKFTQKWFKNRPTFDTQAIFKEVHLRPHQEKLEKILAHYGIPHEHMHNAGNDAYYTLVTALRLADLAFVPPPSDKRRLPGDPAQTPLIKRHK